MSGSKMKEAIQRTERSYVSVSQKCQKSPKQDGGLRVFIARRLKIEDLGDRNLLIEDDSYEYSAIQESRYNDGGLGEFCHGRLGDDSYEYSAIQESRYNDGGLGEFCHGRLGDDSYEYSAIQESRYNDEGLGEFCHGHLSKSLA